MKRSSYKQLAALILIIGIGAAVAMRTTNESPLDKANRVCRDCGMFGLEIDQLIDQVRSSGLTPAESVKLWKQTAEPNAAVLCMPCVEAIVLAAG